MRLATLVFLTFVMFGCHAAPTKEEARTAILAVDASLDSATVTRRVWRDGPPWFSCAEVFAKSRSSADTSAVKTAVGNWRHLVIANLMTFRDSSAGFVTEPGWCVATPRDEALLVAQGWRSIAGDSTPMGHQRRGWDVDAGRRHLIVSAPPRETGSDSATVDYIVAVNPNENGLSIGAQLDSLYQRALLVRDGSLWRAVRVAAQESRSRTTPARW